MARKNLDFNTNNPLVVSIHRESGVWEISAKASNGHFGQMKNRLNDPIGGGRELRDEIDDFYTCRIKGGAPAHPPFVSDTDHPPIMMREGETVQFECDPAFEFTISCDRD